MGQYLLMCVCNHCNSMVIICCQVILGFMRQCYNRYHSNAVKGRLILYMYFYRINFSLLPRGKRPLGKPRRIWENEIRMDLKEFGLGV
jgi:hypothetical protein